MSCLLISDFVGLAGADLEPRGGTCLPRTRTTTKQQCEWAATPTNSVSVSMGVIPTNSVSVSMGVIPTSSVRVSA